MMAGVVPKRSTSGRKQWTLHGKPHLTNKSTLQIQNGVMLTDDSQIDGPRSSLKQLRNQLATDGCPESQVVLAKQLLDGKCDVEAEARENAKLGVYWLIKASEQGNLEATDLLKTCLETGKGISDLNYLDVKQCVNMSQEEKVAQKAAREMFATLSSGGDYITSDQLQKRILSIDRGCANGDIKGQLVSEIEEEDWSECSSGNKKLTEDLVVSAAIDYCHGQLPMVSQIMCFDPDFRTLDHIHFMHKAILHPLLVLKHFYFRLVNFFGSKFHLLPLARTEFQLICLVFVYFLVSSDNFLYFFPMLIYYVSFIIMMVTTCQMLQTKRDFLDFRRWSKLFICYSGSGLNPDQAEFQYIRNNLTPYGHFFIALLANLLIYPVIVDQWMPQSELTIISFCFIFMTLFGFLSKKNGKILWDFWVLFSFSVNVLAKYPYETDPVVGQGWRFLDLNIPTFASYIVGNGIEFCINFRLLLYICIPVVLVKIASKQKWRGTYKTLIPHCVTLSWLQICIINSQGATMYGLLRGTLALVGFVLFLPLVGLTSVILPAIALTKWILTSYFLYNICIFSFILVFSFGLCWMLAQSRLRKFAVFAQIFALVLAVFSLLNSLDLNYDHCKQPKFLSWEIYQRFCNQPIWQEENVALAQLKCAELHGSHVQWDGYVNDVRVKSISNSFQAIFDKFPVFLREYFYCLSGENVGNDCEQFPNLVKDDCNLFYTTIKSINKCSLRKFNKYTFEITIKMHSGIWGKSAQVSLIVGDYFKNFTLGLKPNDQIWFKGVLFNNELVGANGILGGSNTHVLLEEIGCLDCTNSKLADIKISHESQITVRSIINSLVLSVKFLLNVLLSPVVFLK